MSWEKGAKRTLGTFVGIALATLAAGVALKINKCDFSSRKAPGFEVEVSGISVPDFNGFRNIRSELEQEVELKPESEAEYESEKPEYEESGLIDERIGNLELRRTGFSDNSTMGELYLDNEFLCYTLELPYRDNQQFRSCIPVGKYGLEARGSDKFGKTYEVENVPTRTDIIFHRGNFPKDTKGCILVGDSKGKNSVNNSRKTMRILRERLRGYDSLELTVRDAA